ncbi:hypothetical protein PRUPE_4G148500 [Prunus persica]|uniref:Uncharacterized protein n=1 Tax=Prunus persica TaxID=3760 RepID=A0A251PKS6_PRUPE|nr:hypothetical protein PRUPE_4G148500 [Prunus persica]
MIPVRSLCARSKTCSGESWHSCEGILPLNVLLRKRRIIKNSKLSPIHAGICPDNLLLPRSKCFR